MLWYLHQQERALKLSSSYDRVLNLVSTLPHYELQRLQLVVNELLTSGYLPAQGHVEYRFITRSGKPYGPYKYRRIWQNGKLVDLYEGKASPEEYQLWLAQKQAKQVHSSTLKED